MIGSGPSVVSREPFQVLTGAEDDIAEPPI